ncbi:hypothetical protein DFP72DRAFT_1060702 [Ephemerocybe angulata]|uniref:Uncharacterized protein n=1 Tax=Ephemerocybe angulata TaxID=980116 RepID=A0A8H6MBN4_9AGAR|nr:hypothetical protein DFP72DRAFT_1060702 [Tulosesus angulatus]
MFYKAPRLVHGSSKLNPNSKNLNAEKRASEDDSDWRSYVTPSEEDFFKVLRAFSESRQRVSLESTEGDFSVPRIDSWTDSGTPQNGKLEWTRTVIRHFPSSKKVDFAVDEPRKLQPLEHLESLVEAANSFRSGNRVRVDGSRLADSGRRWQVEERTNECTINPSRVVFFWDTVGNVHGTLISRAECCGDETIDVDLYDVYPPQYEPEQGDWYREMEFILAITCPA